MGDVIMTDEKNRWLEAVAQMIKLTQEGKLTWGPSRSFAGINRPDDETFSAIFVTNYKGKNIRIYKRTFKDQRLKRPSLSGSAITVLDLFNQNPEMEAFWNTEVIMEFTDQVGNTLWTFPPISALSDLLSTIQYQVAGVKGFLDDILGSQKE
jgi:hypothetical protein